ncbi:protein disulfide-isomerase 5-1 isoform X1 [Cynara cardunculus var. scolymus]|uniref:protein disulfide-isomerase 5-1 isoform X1 n=1 Tax=Cynara cardunculus var. scolymus TaxID=59895 RepID=UPI000D624F24|nr:protein disulfide-isomerase 5-1 isoform X1 [Cynara cardunculus var. scolymus]
MKADHRLLLIVTLLISSLLLSTLVHVSRAEVITLTETTFSDKVKEKDTAWFVKFCVPWCKHCKSLGSMWEDLGKTMELEDAIEVGEVDCGANRPLCSNVKIGSYPTFKLFYNGEEVARYRGARDVESMRTFVLEETEKAATNEQLEDDKDL